MPNTLSDIVKIALLSVIPYSWPLSLGLVACRLGLRQLGTRVASQGRRALCHPSGRASLGSRRAFSQKRVTRVAMEDPPDPVPDCSLFLKGSCHQSRMWRGVQEALLS